jgi:hypothetical protein
MAGLKDLLAAEHIVVAGTRPARTRAGVDEFPAPVKAHNIACLDVVQQLTVSQVTKASVIHALKGIIEGNPRLDKLTETIYFGCITPSSGMCPQHEISRWTGIVH